MTSEVYQAIIAGLLVLFAIVWARGAYWHGMYTSEVRQDNSGWQDEALWWRQQHNGRQQFSDELIRDFIERNEPAEAETEA